MKDYRRTETHAPPERNWPSASREVTPPTFFVELEKDGAELRIVRRLACGGSTVVRTVVWTGNFDDVPACDEAYDALSNADFDLAFCSVIAAGLDHECATQLIAAAVARHSAERREAVEREAGVHPEQDEDLQEAKGAEEQPPLAVFFRETNKYFRLVLQRESAGAPELWSIAFQERWERERFWDWFKWQDHRWEAIAATTPDVPRLAMERSLIEAMLKDEQVIKKQGLGAGGRRPLRFWRGAE